MFTKDVLYALVDAVGMKNEPFCVGLADYIEKTGGTIKPMIIDAYGNVLAVKFGDGTMSSHELIESFMVKYFEPLDPAPMADVIKFPNKPIVNHNLCKEVVFDSIDKFSHPIDDQAVDKMPAFEDISEFLISEDFEIAHKKFHEKMKNSKVKFLNLEPKTVGDYQGQAA